MYNESGKQKAEAKLVDMMPKSIKKGFGIPVNPTKEKHITHASHKQVSGPSELNNKMQGGKSYGGVDKAGQRHMADSVKESYGHSVKDLKKGHRSIEKVSPDAAAKPPGFNKVKQSKDDM